MTLGFHGIFTPLVTPIDADESPDLDSLTRLVEFQLENQVHGIWAMGTSAEFAAFDEKERAEVVLRIVETTAGRVPVIANISDASTRLAIRHGRYAVSAGADAVAATPPYYYPHSQDELLRHYRAIRDALDVPLFIYNIPQTVRVRVDLTTVQTLVAEGVVAGIKDSQNDLEWFRQLVLFARENNHSLASFAGTRHLIDAAVLVGADGAIPSIANAFPALCVRIYNSAASGDFATASSAQRDVVAIESVAAGVQAGSRNAAVLGILKAILYRRGIIATPRLTSPLRPLPVDEMDTLLEAFAGSAESQTG